MYWLRSNIKLVIAAVALATFTGGAWWIYRAGEKSAVIKEAVRSLQQQQDQNKALGRAEIRRDESRQAERQRVQTITRIVKQDANADGHPRRIIEWLDRVFGAED